MYRRLIFMIALCCVDGFNVQPLPVKNFTNNDPLFGQTIIQSTEGVLVSSPTTGNLFECTLEKNCFLVISHNETRNGLRPIASVAASKITEEEHFLVCNQVRTKKSATEYLNGNCTMISSKGKDKLNPVELVSNQDALQNSNNNNNHYHGRWTNHEVNNRRMKRDAQQTASPTEDEDEDDPGTEIAFVLDGSGSISPEDFQKAKDFMYNVIVNVWKTCFDCDFAIVQYGSKIRTELSLEDNEDGNRTLEKVKKIKQLGNLTKTASAIHHVLTTIFVPEKGSKNDSKKIIIVLSDGKILGDSMNLTKVLNMPQMKGITRFAIGVGNALLSDTDAVQEMEDIADKNKFFNVSNYAALDDILSQLEQNIIEGIEGTQGGGFQLQLAEAGFSSHITHDNSVLFGAVGAYDWSGGLILKSGEAVKFLNASNKGPKFSYLGYSVASARLRTKTLYLSGAPRYNLTGGVFIFDGAEKYVLQGEQVGSYYGSVICALDIGRDGYTDHLIVGAPHFHQDGEEGKVLVYKLNKDRFDSVYMELQGDAGQTFARFGAAIASIGDIDGNRHNDVAVGAPLESDGSGSIYIYNGFEDGLKRSQKISPSDFQMKLVHFGQSVSSITNTVQKKSFIAVGSRGVVTVFETTPVIIIKPGITTSPSEVIPLSWQKHKTPNKETITISVCFETKKGKLHTETLPINYQFELDVGVNKKRLSYNGSSLIKSTIVLKPDTECLLSPYILEYLGCYDCFSPIKIKLNFSLALNSNDTPIRILDSFTPAEAIKELVFENECKTKECSPEMTLSDSKISENMIIIGETQSLSINFNLTNTEDPSYMTTLTLIYPNILSLKKTEGHCPVKNDSHIQCLPLYPEPVFKKGEKTSISISWQLNDTKSELHHLTKSEIIANLTSKNGGSQDLDSKIFTFDVMYSLPIQLTGKASPQRFHIEGGKRHTSQMQFIFEFVGENKYGATIDVAVTITKEAFNTDMTINNVTPKECAMNKFKRVETLYSINCTMKELQKIIINTTVLIHDVKEKSDKITAVAKYSFNEATYTSKNHLRTVPVEVIITKLAVIYPVKAIIGGSIGGLLLLIIIIIILVKCGFFRRRRKMDQGHTTD